MVISRTPLRMSLVGGGTDLPDFFERHGGGAVVSTAIDKYVHVIVSPRFEGDFRIGYSRTEIREHAQRNVRSALTDLREVPFRFSASGRQIRLVEQQWRRPRSPCSRARATCVCSRPTSGESHSG